MPDAALASPRSFQLAGRRRLDGVGEFIDGLVRTVRLDLNGRRIDILPLDADDIVACKPVYESFPGWSESTVGVTQWDALPLNARRYLERVQALIGAPIDMVSTGPDREQTILLRHPFQD